MSYPNDPLTDQLGPTKQGMLGLDKHNNYQYRCSDCQHEDAVPEVVIAEWIASGDCKPGHLPRLVCPICGGPFRAIGSGRLRAVHSLSARWPFSRLQLRQRVQVIGIILTLAICGGQQHHAQVSRPVAYLRLTSVRPTASFHATAAVPAPTSLATAPPKLTITSAPLLAPPTVVPTLDQYRAWMEEAHALHPYSESTDVMWAVMLCESSGDPAAVAGAHFGLFQYEWATWAGDWNPYRDQPMLDPRAQIFATAKAWQDGYQYWWECYD